MDANSNHTLVCLDMQSVLQFNKRNACMKNSTPVHMQVLVWDLYAADGADSAA